MQVGLQLVLKKQDVETRAWGSGDAAYAASTYWRIQGFMNSQADHASYFQEHTRFCTEIV